MNPLPAGRFAQARMIFALLTPAERRRSVWLLGLAVGMALLDTLGVASVLPFLTVVARPEVVGTNAVLAWLYRAGGFSATGDFLFALGVAALAFVVVAALCRAFAQYAILRFTNMRRYSISVRLFNGYLARPYAFFLNRNSADLAKRTLSDIDLITDNCLTPGVQLFAYAVVVVMLLALLVAVDPLVAGVIIVVVCGVYGAIYLASRRMILRAGSDGNLANRQRFTEASEAFGGIKEIKLLGAEADHARRFAVPEMRYSRHRATSDTVALIPRYLIEAVAFGGAIVTALALLRTDGGLAAALPLLGLYAFAGYKLLPAVQQIYYGMARLRFGMPMVATVLEDLARTEVELARQDDGPALPLERSLRLANVTFRYPGAAQAALSGIDIEISAHTTVGFIGTTGAGKSTAVDLILALLDPDAGQLLVDGTPVTDANRRAWQRNIGYVPQSIFLADISLAENIAFGTARDAIDMAAVERAARLANIHDFIVGELPAGYDTEVGERGVRLSGGQRQRIGIARALYRDPSMLVFDEATSALDNATEAAVMEAIGNIRNDKTIIIVAHRLSTVEGCNRVFEFERGTIVGVREMAPAKPVLATAG